MEDKENIPAEQMPELESPKQEERVLRPGFKNDADRPGFLRDKEGNIYDSAYNLVESAPDEIMKTALLYIYKKRPELTLVSEQFDAAHIYRRQITQKIREKEKILSDKKLVKEKRIADKKATKAKKSGVKKKKKKK